MRKIDSRKIKTRELILQTALNILIKDKNKLTISYLTATSKINRNTFYLHFKNIDNLLEDLLSNIQKDIDVVLNKNSLLDNIYSPRLMYNGISDFFEANPDYKDLVFTSKSSKYFYDNLLTYLTIKLLKMYQELIKTDNNSYYYSIYFLLSGYFQTLKLCINKNHITYLPLINKRIAYLTEKGVPSGFKKDQYLSSLVNDNKNDD